MVRLILCTAILPAILDLIFLVPSWLGSLTISISFFLVTVIAAVYAVAFEQWKPF